MILSIPGLSFEPIGSIYLVEDEPDILVMKASKQSFRAGKKMCSKFHLVHAFADWRHRPGIYSLPTILMNAMKSVTKGCFLTVITPYLSCLAAEH